jgi:hypothetical protein
MNYRYTVRASDIRLISATMEEEHLDRLTRSQRRRRIGVPPEKRLRLRLRVKRL